MFARKNDISYLRFVLGYFGVVEVKLVRRYVFCWSRVVTMVTVSMATQETSQQEECGPHQKHYTLKREGVGEKMSYQYE